MKRRGIDWVVLIAACLAALVVVYVALSTPSHAQTAPASLCGFSGLATPASTVIGSGAAFASATITNTAAGLTVPTLTNGTSIVAAVIVVVQGAVRERHDGTDPTIVLGIPYGTGQPAGSAFVSCGSDIPKLRVIRNGGTNGIINYYFFVQGR